MKRLCSAAIAVLAAVTSMTFLCACSENIQNTGNKIVSNAKDYLQSEAGFDGNVSKLQNDAVSYLHEELGLNNNANQAVQGTWKSDKSEFDWVWTFDGSNKCLLRSQKEQFEGEGTYSVDEAKKTVDIAMNQWGETLTFTYKLRKTLSDEYLDLTGESQSYNLIKQK